MTTAASNNIIHAQHIRPAIPADAPAIASLLVAAMESFACAFVGSNNPADAIPVFTHFAALPANQYSYTNTLVYQNGPTIAGIITAYDGAHLETLRAPFFIHLQKHHNFNPASFNPETGPGEYYLDTVSVSPNHRGQGIGKALILAACATAQQQGHQYAGLLVDISNSSARKLYAHLGFFSKGEKQFAGGNYEHMVMPL